MSDSRDKREAVSWDYWNSPGLDQHNFHLRARLIADLDLNMLEGTTIELETKAG
jgi:hypothetical protein